MNKETIFNKEIKFNKDQFLDFINEMYWERQEWKLFIGPHIIIFNNDWNLSYEIEIISNKESTYFKNKWEFMDWLEDNWNKFVLRVNRERKENEK